VIFVAMRKITTKFQKCNQITTLTIDNNKMKGAKLPQNFKNAIKSQRNDRYYEVGGSAKLPQNFKNAIKSQPCVKKDTGSLSAKLPQNFKNAIKSQLILI